MSDINLDKSVLGSCLQDRAVLAKVTSACTKEYFSTEYQNLGGVVLGYYRKYRKTITWDVLEHLLKQKKVKLDKILFLKKLYDDIISDKYDVNEYDYFFDEFRKRYWSNILKDALLEKDGKLGAVDLLTDKKNPIAAWEKIKEVGLKIEASRNSEEVKRGDIKESVDSRLEQYEHKKANPSEAYGLLTDFRILDDATKGLKPGEVLVIAGRPGSGKSLSAMVMGKNAYKKHNRNVLLISIEMPKEQYELRFDASYTCLEMDKIELGKLSPEEEEKYRKALEEIKTRKNWFYIIDRVQVTPLTIESELETVLQKFHPDLLIIDYIGIMRADERQKSDNEEQARIIEGVRRIARQYMLPTICPVQLNRDMAKHRKGTERLSRSDVIGQTADVVVQIDERDDDDEVSKLDNSLTFHIVKNRKGKSGISFTMYSNPATMSVDNPDEGAAKSLEDLDAA